MDIQYIWNVKGLRSGSKLKPQSVLAAGLILRYFWRCVFESRKIPIQSSNGSENFDGRRERASNCIMRVLFV